MDTDNKILIKQISTHACFKCGLNAEYILQYEVGYLMFETFYLCDKCLGEVKRKNPDKQFMQILSEEPIINCRNHSDLFKTTSVVEIQGSGFSSFRKDTVAKKVNKINKDLEFSSLILAIFRNGIKQVKIMGENLHMTEDASAIYILTVRNTPLYKEHKKTHKKFYFYWINDPINYEG